MASGAAATGLATMSESALKDFHTVRHSSGLQCDEPLEAAIERLRQSETTSYVCAVYGQQGLTLRAEGDDGFLGLASHLSDDDVAYASQVVFFDDPVHGAKRKQVFFLWVGAGVGGLLRARVSMHRNDALKFFKGDATIR